MFVEDDFIQEGEKTVIYTYSTRNLNKNDKVRFYYALKGRDGKSGLVKEKNITYLAKTVLMAPYKYDNEVQEFFRFWKIPITRRYAVVSKLEQRGYLQIHLSKNAN